MNPAQQAVALLTVFAGKFEAAGFARAASEALRVARALDTLEWVRSSFAAVDRCLRCGGELPPYAGRGAPRKYCTTCSPKKNSGKVGVRLG